MSLLKSSVRGKQNKSALHQLYNHDDDSGVAKAAYFGGKRGCGQGKEGQKGCVQNEGSQQGCRAWRVTMG